jgi:hypothetical protein
MAGDKLQHQYNTIIAAAEQQHSNSTIFGVHDCISTSWLGELVWVKEWPQQQHIQGGKGDLITC